MADSRNFDQKLFMFPESYNELRKELTTHWSHDKNKKPYWGDWQCGWAMAFDAEEFISYMNRHLGNPFNVLVATRDDELAIGHICKIFLTELRKRRGELNP